MPHRRAKRVESGKPSSDFRTKIDRITAVPSNPNLRRIHAGGRIVATLTAVQIDELGLRTGLTWCKTLMGCVQDAQELHRAHRNAMALLARRRLSEAELADRLAARGYTQSIVARVVHAARDAGWVDDAALAHGIAESLNQRRPAGRRLIEQTLRRRKVATSELGPGPGPATERLSALRLAEQRLDKLEGIKPETAARRIAGLLSRRGFDDDVIAHALQTLKLPHDPIG